MMEKVDETDQQGQPEADDAYLNVVAAASHLGVHPGTIRKAISDKRLKSVRVYGRVVVSRGELERYRTETYPDGIPKRGRPGPSPRATTEEDD